MVIVINELELLTKTGFYDWERKVGVKLNISCEVLINTKITTLLDTVNYVDLIALIEAESKQEFLLIEELITAINDKILNDWKCVEKVKTQINKGHLPIKNSPKKGITITETRQR